MSSKEEDGMLVKLYKKVKAKLKEEVQQFNEMGGWSNAGEYVAQNATTLARQGAEALGEDKLAQDIEANRKDIVGAGKYVDAKIKEEVQQFNEMGGWSNAGEYVAQNATTLARQGAEALGADELAKNIEANRKDIVGAGKYVDAKIKDVDAKIKEEVQQFNEMGGWSNAGEYVAQNATTLARQGAEALGEDELAQDIENNREDIVGAGKYVDAKIKAVDAKIKEEVQQFNEMGGWSNAGEYVAQNATTFARQGAEALGADELAKNIEANREDIVGAGKAVDAKIKEEVQQFNEMGGWSNAGEYVAQNATTLARQGAEALGADKLAQDIEKSRSDALNVGRDVDNVIALVKQDVKDCLAEQRGEIQSSPKARSQDMRLQKKIAERPESVTHKQSTTDENKHQASTQYIACNTKDNSR